jgi:hypothetical protein
VKRAIDHVVPLGTDRQHGGLEAFPSPWHRQCPMGRAVIGLDDDNAVPGWYNAVRDTLSATGSDDCRHRPATCAIYGLFAPLVMTA